ncbi:hypothetical protein EYZ11_001962 [Aspergillus tanneri]|uniref:Dentin matrix acidic phosphoprotein 1 n=1 Tax=Aspergillus tanneri TaxID=1220188 RepID=A0A4S3JS05_9EURO|nr:Dentin matrix acidic phosphoprotein 1 [Aspergillus tanneri]KAA8648316.1 Dentin matrix acidic phosphoprotein 1 [Aspergillus tanneri]THC98532.1 hypothetical protein EYZ11_001962 [Aspergillus tanneri]
MSDSTLYLYTSLTAGSSHIVTATARLETILKANKLPFRAIDVATDDAARKLWGRRSKGKKLPGLVKFGTVVGDLEEIEEWNEYGELRMQVDSVEDFDSMPATSYPATTAQADTTSAASTPTAGVSTPKQSTIKIQNLPSKETKKDDSIAVALRQAGEEAASKAKENARGDTKAETTAAATEEPGQQLPSVAGEEKKEGVKDSVCQKSLALGTAESPRRPPLVVPDVAAVSTADIRADNAEALGLIEHHRRSVVSATSSEEQEKVARDLRKSISDGREEIVVSEEERTEKDNKAKTVEEDSEIGEGDKTRESTRVKTQ